MTIAKSKTLKAIAAVWVVAIITLCSITAYAAYVTLSVPNIQQAKSQWCWAACVEMSANYLGYDTYDQWDIVNHVFGTTSNPYPDKPGGDAENNKGMKYATSNSYKTVFSTSLLSISSMNTEMTNKRPIIMAWGYYTNGKRTGGHENVIYAVDTSTKYLKLQDPDGTSNTVSYSSLTSSSTRKYDQTYKIAQN